MPMPEINVPPKWILFFLWPFKGEPCFPQVEGDLSEEFQQQKSEFGMRFARRWYYREVCRNLGSLVWRRETIPIIILPILCILITLLLLGFSHRLFVSLLFPNELLILSGHILCSSITGLIMGIIFSRILKGHERLFRLVLCAYCLGFFMVMILETRILSIQISPGIMLLGMVKMYWGFIWLFICIWLGSIWIERHHCRHSSA